MAKKKVVDFVTAEYMPELQRQLEEIAYDGGSIKSLAAAMLKRMKEFDCTVPESEQRCAMCLLGRIFSEVKQAAEHAESAINSIDKVIVSKVKPDAPPKQMPAEPKKRTRASKIKVVKTPEKEEPKKRAKKEKPAEPAKKEKAKPEKAKPEKVSEKKPKERVPKEDAPKKERKPKAEKPAEPKPKKVKKVEDKATK